MVCECIANGKWGWSPEKLIGLGLKEDSDGTPWGTDWSKDTQNFTVWVDCSGVVKLFRRNPDSDPIVVHIDTMEDLRALLDFIQD